MLPDEFTVSFTFKRNGECVSVDGAPPATDSVITNVSFGNAIDEFKSRIFVIIMEHGVMQARRRKDETSRDRREKTKVED